MGLHTAREFTERWPRHVRPSAIAVVLAIAGFGAPPSAAQAVQIGAGTSSLFDATGGSLEVRSAQSRWTFGAGRLGDAFVGGLKLDTRIKGRRVTLGDDLADFSLPTDFNVSTRAVPVRGGGVTFVDGAVSTWAFASTTSTTTGVPFFRGGTWDQPVGMVFVSVKPRPQWQFASRNVVAARVTSIQSVEWLGRSGIMASASAGLGVGQPFTAVKARVIRRRVDAQASYSTPADQFRRIDVDTPMAGETEREAFAVTASPFENWRLTGSRQHLVDSRGTQARATVHQLSSAANIAAFRVSTGVFSTERRDLRLFGTSLAVARRVGETLDVGVDYFRSRDTRGDSTETASLRVKKDVNARLSVTPVLTSDGEQVSLNVGGQFISNALVAHVGYLTTYVPFGERSFVRTIALDVRVQLGALQLTTSTYVTPYGALRYTVSGTHIRSLSGGARAGRPRASIGRYVVATIVVDETDKPIAGAALQVGDEVAITDDRGRFTVHLDDRRPRLVSVRLDEFLGPGTYEVVDAPARVTPQDAGRESPIVIRVRRR